MFFFKKKKNNINTNDVKENLVNYVFDNILKENEHYTVISKFNGEKLVKKVTRWANFKIIENKIQAIFSIETDKGVFCFQLQDEKLNFVPNEICELLHPELLPK